MDALLDRRLDAAPVVILDTETTGLHPGLGHRVVEIGAIRMEPSQGGVWQVTARMNELLNPGRRMDPDASRVNRIFDQDLVDAPPFRDVVEGLLKMLDGAVLAAHNASFDAGFLGMELAILNLNTPDHPGIRIETPWLCTLQLARRHFYFGRNSLQHVARNLGVRAGRAHRALNDVYVTAEVLKRMWRELSDLGWETVGDLLYAQGGAIFTPEYQVLLPNSLAEALAEGQSVRIRYRAQSGETVRIIDPLYPTEFQGNGYLVAYCHLRRDQRTFRLDRMLEIEKAKPSDG